MTADQVATDIYQKSGLFQVLQQEHGTSESGFCDLDHVFS